MTSGKQNAVHSSWKCFLIERSSRFVFVSGDSDAERGERKERKKKEKLKKENSLD